jgi:glycosyltransferase involved in cell wall biosynthesis
MADLETMGDDWPSVTVVIPTRDRPEQLRAAIAAIGAQDYPGPVDVRVVFDQVPVDTGLPREDLGVPVAVMPNERTAGLCGGRNTGILTSRGDFVAFCDDDDIWLDGKLRAQVAALRSSPGASFASTSIFVEYKDSRTARLAGKTTVTHADLLRSRMTMLHSSTFLAERRTLVDTIGLLDEGIPGSMCEDWDILLRASAVAPIVHVDQPLVRVLWGQTSFFARRWETKLQAHLWMLEHHPDIWTSRIGAGRLLGQIAFDHAALGQKRAAVSYASQALRRNPREHRAVFAVLVAARLMKPSQVLALLHRYGRGI